MSEILNADGSRNWQANILQDRVKQLEEELQKYKDMEAKGLEEYKDVGGCWGCNIQESLNQVYKDYKALKEDYKVLENTYTACEKEYKALAKRYHELQAECMQLKALLEIERTANKVLMGQNH